MAKKAKKQKTVNKGGAPSKYKKVYAERAFDYCQLGGFSTSFLAEKFGVTVRTVQNWLKRHKEFKNAVDRGREIAIEQVESSLFKLALGGLEKIKTKSTADEDGTELMINERIIETAMPSVQACKEILSAYKKQYRNKLDIGGQEDNPIFMQPSVINKKYVKKDADGSDQ